MAAALPIVGGVLGIANAFMGLRGQAQQQRALSRAEGLTEEQAKEFSTLRAIMADPNHPMRGILRAQAEQAIGRQTAGGVNELQARLAASGFRSPGSAAAPISNILARGVSAQGELERNLISDYLQKRVALAGGPETALKGGLSIADIAGQQASGAGQALGNILAAFQQGAFSPQRRSTGGYSSFQPYDPIEARRRSKMGFLTGF